MKILDPYYGNVLCNGDVVGRKCQFTCYDGFKLSGPQERSCQANQSWSGKNTKCLRKFKSVFDYSSFVFSPILLKIFKHFDFSVGD